MRRALRVIGLIIYRDHLFPGADSKQVFGAGGAERDDVRRPRLDDDVAVGGVNRDGECGGTRCAEKRHEDEAGRKGCDENEGTTKHESSFREGFEVAASDRSSDSGLPPPPPSRACAQ